MVTVLDRIDEEVNWSDNDFTKLEAEIVMDQHGASRSKIVSDLIQAIRKDHLSRAFILIGDPGSGKSVSLRHLARELYVAVPSTNIVPVYVNLREWDGPQEPTDSDIVDFISRYLLKIFRARRSSIPQELVRQDAPPRPFLFSARFFLTRCLQS